MLKNYLKIAWRNLAKHKMFSALNIFGLATSMSVCLLLIMILTDQYSYDNFHENGDRIYRVITNKKEKNISIKVPDLATTSLNLAEPLKEVPSLIEKVTRVVQVGLHFEINGEVGYPDNVGFVVDDSFLDMFSFGWLKGDKKTALSNPQSIVLTEKSAKKFFPEGEVIGKTLQYGDLGLFTITGLMPNPPLRSHIYFDYLISYATINTLTKESREQLSIYDEKQVWRGMVYTLLEKGSSNKTLDNILSAHAKTYSDRDPNNHYLFQSQALANVMPSNDLGNEIGTATPKFVLYFLMSLGFLLMLAACFNYMNLSIARSLKRSKEIGIRKVVGARKKDIIIQFLGEAVMIAFLSLLVALVLLELLIPAFYNLDPFVAQTFHLVRTPQLYLGFFCFSVVIGLLAGVFPAFNISSFQAIQSIKQLSNLNLFSKIGIRKALVTVQFSLSLVFILIVLIVLQQQAHVKQADLGLRTDNLMSVWMNDKINFDVFSQQVAQINGVEGISSSSIDMLTGGNTETIARYKDNKDSFFLEYNAVAQNYVDFMEIELVAGENFPEGENSESEQFIILNETAIKRMGYKAPKEALDQTLALGNDGDINLKIIGVAKDFHHDNVWFAPIKPYALRQGGKFQKKLEIRLSDVNTPATIATIHEVWNKLSLKKSMSAYFIETRMYHLDKFFRMGSRIIGFIGFLTILISCMGLLGMVVYTVEGKLKEVGIRKVLGASESSLNWQLSKGFLILLAIAILIAVPLTVFLGNLWLQNFVLRTSISIWMILFGVGLMLLLALGTIISQTLIAVRVNPVETLKAE